MNTPGYRYVAAVMAKAEAGGVHAAELAALRRRLRQLGEHEAGRLPGDVLKPLPDLPRVDELPEPSPGQARGVLGRLVVVRLNGGLGTGMGLSGPKSLLEVKPGTRFLGVIATQVLAASPIRSCRHSAARLANREAGRGPRAGANRHKPGILPWRSSVSATRRKLGLFRKSYMADVMAQT